MNKRKVRYKLWKKHGKKCHICKKGLSLAAATIDHLIPISSGGGDNKENLAIAHGDCNRRRGSNGIFYLLPHETPKSTT